MRPRVCNADISSRHIESDFTGRRRSMRLSWQSVALLGLMALTGCGKTDGGSGAGGWRGEVKQLQIAMTVPSDSEASGTKFSYDPLQNYLAQATGIPVKIHATSDIYTSSIQALASGQVDLALLAGGGYVNVREQVGKDVSPLLIPVGSHGEIGYYSSLIVRADSPYHSLADLKGKSLALTDYNSASGYLMPMHAMRQQGITPEGYFSKIGLAGGHPQVVTAVFNHQYDAGWTLSSSGTPEAGFLVNTWERMEAKGLLPKGAIRNIWNVGPVPNAAFVIRSDRPQALKDLLSGALAAASYDNPEVYTSASRLPGATWEAGDDAMFAEMAKLRQEAIAGQRAAAGGGRPAAGGQGGNN